MLGTALKTPSSLQNISQESGMSPLKPSILLENKQSVPANFIF